MGAATRVDLSHLAETSRERSSTVNRGLPEKRLRRVVNYIADNLETNISLSKLAAIAEMSPHYFSGLFKQSTGRSPHSYILLQRIERAKQHLRDPKRSIIDVGLEAGFKNPSHFARIFRKFEGTTPSRFRADYLQPCVYA
ncbi:MAG TPA: AraC family transcriptional regulator [Candidatus Angelobacter sp.]|nr:AraC family transcriptional regulator [Candidatus Angelobacter sp.]HEX5435012.1 AraC family transcriptional regulator [Candidatus Angelobacter sp.]